MSSSPAALAPTAVAPAGNGPGLAVISDGRNGNPLGRRTSILRPSKLDLFNVGLNGGKSCFSPGDKVGGRVNLVVGGAGGDSGAGVGVAALWLDYNSLCEIHLPGGGRNGAMSRRLNHDTDEDAERGTPRKGSAVSSSHSFYRHRVQLLPEGLHTLGPGRHEFPFMFVLPRSLPPSLEVKGGTRIIHRLQAVLDNPWGSESSPETIFQMDSDQDLNAIPTTLGLHAAHLIPKSLFEVMSLLDPIETLDTKVFGACSSWCKSGPLTVAIYVPKRGFAHGERIPVSMRVDNSTSNTVEVRLRLIHETVITEKKKEVGNIETEVASNESIGIVERGSKVDKLIEMMVPFEFPVTFDGKYQHIDLVYYLVTEGKFVKERSFSFQLSKSEVIVGAVPHNSESRSAAVRANRARRNSNVGVATVATPAGNDGAAAAVAVNGDLGSSLGNGTVGNLVDNDSDGAVDEEEEEVEFNIF